MDVCLTITIPDYLFQFYQKVADHLGDRTTEEIIESALFSHAGMVAQELIHPNLKDEPDELDE